MLRPLRRDSSPCRSPKQLVALCGPLQCSYEPLNPGRAHPLPAGSPPSLGLSFFPQEGVAVSKGSTFPERLIPGPLLEADLHFLILNGMGTEGHTEKPHPVLAKKVTAPSSRGNSCLVSWAVLSGGHIPKALAAFSAEQA